jgi:hypothetical protein
MAGLAVFAVFSIELTANDASYAAELLAHW